MRYEDVELGDDLPEMEPDVSLARVTAFCKSSGFDRFARFTDSEQAKREGLPGAVVPGIMSQAFLSAMIHRWAPGCSITKLDTVFRSLILVDSSPTCSAAVTDTDDDTGTAEIDLVITNDEGNTAVMGTALVTFAE